MKLGLGKSIFFCVLALLTLSTSVAHAQVSVNITAFGGNGDGVTDNHYAFSSAFAYLLKNGGGTLTVPPGDYRILTTSSPISISPNTSVVGVPGQSIIDFDTNQTGTTNAYRALFWNQGNNISLVGLTIRRASDFPAVFFPVHSFSGFNLISDTIIGNEYPGDPYYAHGFELAVCSGATSNISFENTTLTGLDYGVYETNTATATVNGISVSACTFTGNYADDLEFNGPAGPDTNISVTDSSFTNNKATGIGCGFGIGLANSAYITIAGNTFSGYNAEALHIEDNSTNVSVYNNTISSAGLTHDSFIQVISGSNNISITGNVLNASNNTDAINLINVEPGGTTFKAPSSVTVSNNSFTLGALQSGADFMDVPNLTVSNNTVTRTTGSAATGWGIQLFDCHGYYDVGNTFKGLTLGLYLNGS